MKLLAVIIIAAGLYIWLRVKRVAEFRQQIFNLVFDERPDFKERLKIYHKVNFNKMLFSFKPVNMKYFYTKEEIIILTHL